MVYTAALDPATERYEGSNPSWSTLWACGETGIHTVLKQRRLRSCGFDSHLAHFFKYYNMEPSDIRERIIREWIEEGIIDMDDIVVEEIIPFI